MSGSPFEFSRSTHKFYISGSEKEMMRRISDILRKQGYVGIADTSGVTQFFLESDSNPYRVLKRIRDVQNIQQPEEDHLEKQLVVRIEDLLKAYGFPQGRKGTVVLRDILFYLSAEGQLNRLSNKNMYDYIGERTGQTASQIERNIRYAVTQSHLQGSNTKVIFELLNKLWTVN